MHETSFDRISKMFAARRMSRRQALVGGGAGLAAAISAGSGLAVQAATPVTEATPAGAGKVPYLFVQSYGSASIAASDDASGLYAVTLDGGVGQTLYFSDRPARDVGVTPTGRFLDGLGFDPDNPPNAALVLERVPGEQETAVVELFNPAIDEAGTVRYDVKILGDWDESLAMKFATPPADLAGLASSFGPTHLFIDDCADPYVTCIGPGGETGLGPRAFCWSGEGTCEPCAADGYAGECNQAYPDICQDKCGTTWPCNEGNCG